MEGSEEDRVVSQENLEPLATCLIRQEAAKVTPSQTERVPFQQVSHNLGGLLSGAGSSVSVLGLEGGALHAKLQKRATRVTQPLEDADAGAVDNFQQTNVNEAPLSESQSPQVSKRALGKAERVSAEARAPEGEESDGALQAGAKKVGCSEEQGGVPKDEPSLTWFPRAKKDSYLERKIKRLQESEGPKEHLGEAFVKKMSRVEREKKAAAAAAEAALAAKKAALVEVSWCRILEAAGIHSKEAHVQARAAESEASKAANTAVSLGVVLSPNGPHRASPFGASRVSRGYRDVIFAATHSEADVEKEVVTAVKEALRKAKLTMTAGEMRSASESERMASKDKDRQRCEESLQPLPAGPESALSGTSQPQENQSAGIKSPRRGAETPQSPGKGKAPGASLFGGLLMACLSPRGRERDSLEVEDGSSSEEEEHQNGTQETSAAAKESEQNEYEEDSDSEDEKKDAPLPSWGQKKTRSKAVERYAQATESDEEEVPPLRAFSPAKSPVRASPSKAPGRHQPGSPAFSPQREEDEQRETDEERLVGEMLTRLVGLSEEQRQVVGSIVAARGFGGFLKSSPFLTRPDQSAKPSGFGDDFVIKRSKLEIAKAEAVAKAKESGAHKEQARVEQSHEAEQGLGEILVKRMSKLEKAKADAIAARKTDGEKRVGKERPTQSSAFGEDLVIHKSKLERAKEEAVAAAKIDGEKKERAGTGRFKETESSSFGQDLVIHKSKLERAKEEAVSAAKSGGAHNGRGAKEKLKQTQTSAFGQDLVIHKSKLEIAKEEALAAQKAAEMQSQQTPTSVLSKEQGFGEGLGASPGTKGRPKQDVSAWEGQDLGTLKKHLSRLERDKLAWKEAEEAAKARTAA